VGSLEIKEVEQTEDSESPALAVAWKKVQNKNY